MATKRTIELVQDAVKLLARRGELYNIFKIYEKPSQRKFNAYMDIKTRPNNLFTTCIGGNCYHFTTLSAFRNTETGEIMLAYDTYANTYVCSLTDIEPQAQLAVLQFC